MTRLQASFWAIAARLKTLRLRALQKVVLLLVVSVLLSGCVRYDVGINFAGQNHGEIVQHIRLGEQLTNFSGAIAQEWLKSLEQRTRQVGGRVRHPSKQEIVAIIPFNNGAELQAKFNQFFNPSLEDLPPSARSVVADLPAIASRLTVFQRNFFVVEKNYLTFDLDLRSLGVLSSEGSVLISPGTLLDLEFSLDTPWGAQSPQIQPTDASADPTANKHLVWTLKAGDVNHIEAVFWVPSPLGMGAVVIGLIVALGIGAKSLLQPMS
ncbi:DUF3153 domain-containing protein [Oscillatoria sp. FACHB-1407]|uniref:DUF3153 domain-containing protein n=1 Tax=Oscillatoria sp. FACHB-1407 TaxID=2692847 RepID=UPI0016871080|nr:DUF3153 domain-containing protein [Oscillatoria sp. FACHB-1407]MBD2460037.1 DUF3153 domain-containing protein [Oscillatoria sp. FACHB-1407]